MNPLSWLSTDFVDNLLSSQFEHSLPVQSTIDIPIATSIRLAIVTQDNSTQRKHAGHTIRGLEGKRRLLFLMMPEVV